MYNVGVAANLDQVLSNLVDLVNVLPQADCLESHPVPGLKIRVRINQSPYLREVVARDKQESNTLIDRKIALFKEVCDQSETF